jgi:hypothetical protein
MRWLIAVVLSLALTACGVPPDQPDLQDASPPADANAVGVVCQVIAPLECAPGCGLIPGSSRSGGACLLTQAANVCLDGLTPDARVDVALTVIRTAARAWAASNCGAEAFCRTSVVCQQGNARVVPACDAGCPPLPIWDAAGWHPQDATYVPAGLWSGCDDAPYTALDTLSICRR